MESQDYEHHRNLTLMFFFEKLLEKGGKCFLIFKNLFYIYFLRISSNVSLMHDSALTSASGQTREMEL